MITGCVAWESNTVPKEDNQKRHFNKGQDHWSHCMQSGVEDRLEVPSTIRSRNSPVCAVITPRAGRPGRDSRYGWGFFFSPPHPDWLWSPLSFPCNGYRWLFHWGKAAGTWIWPVTSISPYIFIAWYLIKPRGNFTLSQLKVSPLESTDAALYALHYDVKWTGPGVRSVFTLAIKTDADVAASWYPVDTFNKVRMGESRIVIYFRGVVPETNSNWETQIWRTDIFQSNNDRA
jgi:hypothetical protein